MFSVSLSLYLLTYYPCIASVLTVGGGVPQLEQRLAARYAPSILGYVLNYVLYVRSPSDRLWLSQSFQYPSLRPSLSFSLIYPPPSSVAYPNLIPRILIAGCSHHCWDRRIPGFRSATRHKSMIGRVAMYYATVFWWQETYTLISSRPAIASATPMGGYTHVPSSWFLGPMPAIGCTVRWHKPSRTFSIQGVITHVSDPNRITT